MKINKTTLMGKLNILYILFILFFSIGISAADYTGMTNFNDSGLSLNKSIDFGYTSYIQSIESTITNNAPITILSNGDVMTHAKKMEIDNTGLVAFTNVTYEPEMQSNFDDLRVIAPDGTLLEMMHGTEVNQKYAHIYFKATEPNCYLVYGNPTAARINDTLTIPIADDIDLYYSGTWSTSSVGYVNVGTHTFTSVAGQGYDFYNYNFRVSSDATVTRIIYWKVTAQVGNGVESTVGEGTGYGKYDSHTTINNNVDIQSLPGEEIVVRYYIKRSPNYTYNARMSEVHTRALLTHETITQSTKFELKDKYSFTLYGTGDTETRQLGYDKTTSLLINPIGLETYFGILTDSVDWSHNTNVNYLWTEPNPSPVMLVPNSDKVAVGTIFEANIQWTDPDLKNVEFYVDYGTGYVLEDSKTFSNTSEWFNTTINTSAHIGKTINWKQVAFNDAEHSYTYEDSFDVILDQLSIAVYDETTGDSIKPTSVKIYNDMYSYNADINQTTNVATLSYTNLETGKYSVTITADDYYSRNFVMDVDTASLSELNIYLIKTDEGVIFDTFQIIDNSVSQISYRDYIIEIRKPGPSGTQIIFNSYFDFTGAASTYLIAGDQYMLYVITPERTIAYGWLTPDPDGLIEIAIQDFKFIDDSFWLQFEYTGNDNLIRFDYSADKNINNSKMEVRKDNIILYSDIAYTDSGSFIYNVLENGTYIVSIDVLAEDGDTYTFSNFIEVGRTDILNPFPESYTKTFIGILISGMMFITLILLGKRHLDVGIFVCAAMYSFSVYQEWIIGSAISVAFVAILAMGIILSMRRNR